MRTYSSGAVVVIDSFPQSVRKYKEDHALILVDVMSTTTTAITAVAAGRRCFPVTSLEEALARSMSMADERPLTAGDLGRGRSNTFGIASSPLALAERSDVERPLILLTAYGSSLFREAEGGLVTFLASLRNCTAAAEFLLGRYRKVAVIAAGTKNEFREEDQLCCARIAGVLADHGYKPENRKTKDLISHWRDQSVECLWKSSHPEVRRIDRGNELDFIVTHVDDINAAFLVAENEVLMIPREFYEPEGKTVSEEHVE